MMLTIKYANDSNIYSFDDEHRQNWKTHCANSHSGIKEKKKQQQQHTNGYLQAIFKTANTNDRIQA